MSNSREIDSLAQEVERLKNRLNESQQVAKIGSWEFDMATGEVWWSDETYRIFECDPKTFIPSTETIKQLYHPDDIKPIEAACARAIEEKTDYAGDLRIITKKGRIKNCHFKGSIKYNSDGDVVTIYGTIHNITERKQSEQKYQKLFESASDGIFILQNTDQGPVFTDCNVKVLEMFGCSPKDIIGKTPAAFSPEMQPDGTLSSEKIFMIAEAAMAGETQMLEWSHTRLDNTHFDVDLTINRIDIKEDIFFQAIVRDITERKRLQEIIIQTEKMMSVGGLAAGIAHEIRNPLSGIIQNIQIIRNRLFGDMQKNIEIADKCGVLLEHVREYASRREIDKIAQDIIEAGTRAIEITENVLSFSRKSEAEFSLHDLTELMDMTINLVSKEYSLKKKLNFRDISIMRNYEANMPQVECEAGKIQQVFMNILNNGAEEMHETGTSSPCFNLKIMRENGMARVEIQDNGPGMPEEVRKRVFEPFFTTKSSDTGTGLGLSVSYFIIHENHGGIMDVESAPGAGTRFIIKIPLRR